MPERFIERADVRNAQYQHSGHVALDTNTRSKSFRKDDSSPSLIAPIPPLTLTTFLHRQPHHRSPLQPSQKSNTTRHLLIPIYINKPLFPPLIRFLYSLSVMEDVFEDL